MHSRVLSPSAAASPVSSALVACLAAVQQPRLTHSCNLLQEKGYVTADVAEQEGLHQLKLSGTKFRQMLRGGGDIPEWFAFKSVVSVLREATPTSS